MHMLVVVGMPSLIMVYWQNKDSMKHKHTIQIHHNVTLPLNWGVKSSMTYKWPVGHLLTHIHNALLHECILAGSGLVRLSAL